MKRINQIVSVGSVDGILTTAAILRMIGKVEVDIVFTQAFTVDQIDPAEWKPGRQVAFVDLAVHNRDKQMTRTFVEKIKAAGHRIVAICDEHDRNDWMAIMGNFDGFLVEPKSQALGYFKSSGAVLEADKGELLDAHGRMLCECADKADRLEYVGVGELVNKCVKSKIDDDTRRVYLAQYFAWNTEPDFVVQSWLAEYENVYVCHQQILAAKQDLGDGIVSISTLGRVVDMSSLLAELYKSGTRVIVIEGENAASKARQICLVTNQPIDILTRIRMVIPSASGLPQKVYVNPQYESRALAIVRLALGK